MQQELSISVVIPARNEEGGVGQVVGGIPEFVDEVIVVDNESTDRTAEIARSRGATVVESRRGYGSALRRGFEAAKNDVIVAMDADGTYPAEQIARLIDILQRENADFISCSRFPLTDRHAMSRRNAFGNQVLTLLFGLIYGKWLRDSQSGMWIFRRRILALMHFEGTTWEFSSEIKIEACTNPHIKFLETHIDYRPRIGRSHFDTWGKAIAVGIRDIGFLVSQRFVRRRARQRRAYERYLAARSTPEQASETAR
ncbi:MAG TPA: glycosyltransferase family 2 protein [Verrucomicrobiae bacterium]|nr:glycosyltransferase family 2 protein [Verrucomicrobiae bacterium]